MPSVVVEFNLSGAYLSAGRLMDLGARLLLQWQLDKLAKKYDDLQQDASSGDYNTSGLSQQLSGLGRSVDNVTVPQQRALAPRAEIDDNGAGGALGRLEQDRGGDPNPPPVAAAEPMPNAIPWPTGVPVTSVELSPPPAARPSEVEPSAPATSPAGKVIEPPRSDLDLALAVTSDLSAKKENGLALTRFAASGDAEDPELRFPMPGAAPGQRRRDDGEEPLYAEGSEDLPVFARELATEAVADTRVTAPTLVGRAAGKPELVVAKAGGRPMRRALIDSVERVKSVHPEKPGGRSLFSEIKRVITTSSFFKPLDFPGEVSEASFAPPSGEAWWRAIALPVLFTVLASGFVWMRRRQR